MRLFKILWKHKEKPGTWIAFEFRTMHFLNPLFLHFTRNGYAKQWFLFSHIPPFYMNKNNCNCEVGISLLFIQFGFNFQLNFDNGSVLREPRQNHIRIDFSIVDFFKKLSKPKVAQIIN